MATDTSIGGIIGGVTSNINFSGIGSGFGIFILVVAVVVVLGLISYFVIMAFQFNITITAMENQSGLGYVPTRKDKAKLVKIGDSGEQVLYLRKAKIYRQAHGKKIGKNHYLFIINSDDGQWYNATFGDFDKEFNTLGVKLADRDMRYMHVALRRNLAHRYGDKTFWSKYGGLIAYIGLIALVGILTYLLFDKYIKITDSLNAAVQTSQKVMDAAQQVLSGIDAIKNGGSGLKAA